MTKGPYKYSEITGSKCASSSKAPLVSKSMGKMSSAHGTTGQSKQNNMNQGGSNRIGADCPTFKKEGYKLAGPKPNPHAKQPMGHSSKA